MTFDRKAYQRDAARERRKTADPAIERARSARRRSETPEQMREQNRRWRKANPEKTAAFQRKYRFGITQEQFDDLLHEQGGVCAVCRLPMDKPAVDHCHKTGRIRGLLHRRCNSGLGMFDDDLERTRQAVAYLERFQ